MSPLRCRGAFYPLPRFFRSFRSTSAAAFCAVISGCQPAPVVVDKPYCFSTLSRGLVHSTGHESRLNRTFGAHFGDELYSKENWYPRWARRFSAPSLRLPTSTPIGIPPPISKALISRLEEDIQLGSFTHNPPRGIFREGRQNFLLESRLAGVAERRAQ